MAEKVFSHYVHSGACYMDAAQTLSQAKTEAGRITAAAYAGAARILQTAETEALRLTGDAKAEAKRITDAAVAKIRTAGA
jgi:cell division septum initiation protein DivIVA